MNRNEGNNDEDEENIKRTEHKVRMSKSTKSHVIRHPQLVLRIDFLSFRFEKDLNL